METHSRSMIKAITFRIIATAITILLVLVFTGNAVIGLTVGSLELLLKIIVYYFHERVWNMLQYGKKKS